LLEEFVELLEMAVFELLLKKCIPFLRLRAFEITEVDIALDSDEFAGMGLWGDGS